MLQNKQFDYSFLRGRIRELYQTENKFVKELNKTIRMSSGAFNNKINGKTDFTNKEIYEICKLLNIPLEKVKQYFFKENYEFNS